MTFCLVFMTFLSGIEVFVSERQAEERHCRGSGNLNRDVQWLAEAGGLAPTEVKVPLAGDWVTSDVQLGRAARLVAIWRV